MFETLKEEITSLEKLSKLALVEVDFYLQHNILCDANLSKPLLTKASIEARL